jgi:secreted PhoX family phosphatase
VWLIPTRGEDAGNAYLFATGPMECEICGPFLTQNRETLFLAVQHPGEMNGIREGDRTETRKFTLKTTDGTSFVQTREVPIGSNWPDPGTHKPPKPAIVAVRRLDGGAIV